MSNSGVVRKKFMVLLATMIILAGILIGWPFRASRTPANQPSSRWDLRWFNRHKELKRDASTRCSRIVFLGDSITQNWETAGKATWDQYYEPRNALNLGISSDKTQHVLWRVLDTEFGKQPELIVLLVGTNNSLEYSPAEVTSGVEAIIQALREKAPASKLLLLALFPRGEILDDSRREVNEQVNKLIARFDDDERVTYLDVNHVFTNEDGSTKLELMPDALHPNDAGYAAWAAAMEPTIEELLENPKVRAGEVGVN